MECTKLEIAFRQALERRNARKCPRLDIGWSGLAEPALRGQAPEAGDIDYDGVAGTGMLR